MNKSPQKILVTGVVGFLGSHLAEKLSEMNHEIIGVDNMSSGYEDNIPKDIEFHNSDCCDFNKMNNISYYEQYKIKYLYIIKISRYQR